MSDDPIAVGTRGSALALVQARMVVHALEMQGRAAQIVIIETEGDRRAPDTAWGEGAFVAAIERALLDGRVDVAVHSAKDVPTDVDPRLVIGAYLPRADARDALVVPAGATARSLTDLPAGSRVGTDSPRRTGFIRALRPNLVVHPLHGNVDTRLRRLDEGETDALVLACAGLERLGRADRIAERLDPELVPPAPGQGAIAVQIRADDLRCGPAIAAIDDRATRIAVETERAFLTATGGGCRAPIGMLATVHADWLELVAGVADPDGNGAVVTRRSVPLTQARERAAAIAAELRPSAGRTAPPSPRRVIVTRAAAQSDGLIDALAAVEVEAVMVPAIEIELAHPGGELDRAAGALQLMTWVVVTSANGAQAVLAAAERVLAELASPRWAAIGTSTARALETEGIDVDLVPSTADAETLARELPIDTGDRVLVVRGDLAGPGLAEALRRRGAVVDDVIGYRTRLAPASSGPLLRAAFEPAPDGVLLTSGSTVDGLLGLARSVAVDVTALPAICIGPRTERSALDAGFRVVARALATDDHALAAATARALTMPRKDHR
ncbi:MAG TPA: hydroxymethylbilane synthase [Candidatus Limnocylindrales bacterium]|nr:hydroxymethylbilane synthase [Candidatus Limnocylindrales bacterium]